jgi:hypothetical protein
MPRFGVDRAKALVDDQYENVRIFLDGPPAIVNRGLCAVDREVVVFGYQTIVAKVVRNKAVYYMSNVFKV